VVKRKWKRDVTSNGGLASHSESQMGMRRQEDRGTAVHYNLVVYELLFFNVCSYGSTLFFADGFLARANGDAQTSSWQRH